MKLKVLSAPSWTTWVEKLNDDILDTYEEITPILNRPGWYFNRETKKAWLEFIYKGKMGAWKDKRNDDFFYKLEILNHKPLTKNEVSAAVTLLNHHNFPGVKSVLNVDRDWKQLREVYRGSKKTSLKFRKTIRKKKKLIEI